MVVAQLVERSPEIRGSNPVIGKTFIEHLFTANCVEKTKIKKKRLNGHLHKISFMIQHRLFDEFSFVYRPII